MGSVCLSSFFLSHVSSLILRRLSKATLFFFVFAHSASLLIILNVILRLEHVCELLKSHETFPTNELAERMHRVPPVYDPASFNRAFYLYPFHNYCSFLWWGFSLKRVYYAKVDYHYLYGLVPLMMRTLPVSRQVANLPLPLPVTRGEWDPYESLYYLRYREASNRPFRIDFVV